MLRNSCCRFVNLSFITGFPAKNSEGKIIFPPLHYCLEYFKAELSISKTWKEPKCPSTEEWIKKMWYIHKMEYYAAMKKNEIMPLAATWMDLEMIILSEVNQTEKDKYHMIPLICRI